MRSGASSGAEVGGAMRRGGLGGAEVAGGRRGGASESSGA